MNAYVAWTGDRQRASDRGRGGRRSGVEAPVRALPFEHVDHGVDGAEGARAAAAGAAVDDDRTGVLHSGGGGRGQRRGFRPLVLVAADDVGAALDEAEDVGWVGGGAEVGPAGVVELGDFAEGVEGGVGVGEGDFADDDGGVVGVCGGVEGGGGGGVRGGGRGGGEAVFA